MPTHEHGHGVVHEHVREVLNPVHLDAVHHSRSPSRHHVHQPTRVSLSPVRHHH